MSGVLYTFVIVAQHQQRPEARSIWEGRTKVNQTQGMTMTPLEIAYLPTGTLHPYPRNARTHSKKQIKQIADSIRQFGFTNPLLIDKDHIILAGHGRLAAAVLLGLSTVPCVRLEHMTPTQKKAYVVADNKLALNAGWDEEILALELQDLLAVDVGFDLSLTGFSVAEVDGLIEGLAVEESGSPADEALPPLASGQPITQIGDIWQLGQHRLICGSALDSAVVQQLMMGDLAHMVFTDPPYNVPIAGHVSGLGKVQHNEFAMASGEMNHAQFTAFLTCAFQNLSDYSTDGSIHFICMDWRHMAEMLDAGDKVYAELKNLIVWAKDNGGMGSFYRSKHELIFAFKKGTAPHINSFELGQHGRYRTNVWAYRGMNSFGSTRDKDLALAKSARSSVAALNGNHVADFLQRYHQNRRKRLCHEVAPARRTNGVSATSFMIGNRRKPRTYRA